jgi:hypothetical protein
MASPFQRTSSFDQQQGDPALPTPRSKVGAQRVTATPSGPTREDLEHWYRTLDEILDRLGWENGGQAVEEVRDGIYAFLH